MRIFIWCCVLIAIAFAWISAASAQETATDFDSEFQAEFDTAFVTVPADETIAPTATFYQHLDVKRNPQFMIKGLKTAQQIHYQVSSSFRIYPPGRKRVP